jgi:hypothetical protein
MECCLFELMKVCPKKNLKSQKCRQSSEPKGNIFFSHCCGFLATAGPGLKEVNALLCLVLLKIFVMNLYHMQVNAGTHVCWSVTAR